MNIMAWLFAMTAWANGMAAQGCQYNLLTGTFTCPPHVRQTAPPSPLNPSILPSSRYPKREGPRK